MKSIVTILLFALVFSARAQQSKADKDAFEFKIEAQDHALPEVVTTGPVIKNGLELTQLNGQYKIYFNGKLVAYKLQDKEWRIIDIQMTMEALTHVIIKHQ